jgi:hypothetical protein
VKRAPLTDRQKQLIWEVRRCRPYGLRPEPSALPGLEELVERGTLIRRMDSAGRSNYFESEAAKMAHAMYQAIEPQINDAACN